MLYIFEYRVGKTKRQREDDLEKSRTRHIIPKKPPLGGFYHLYKCVQTDTELF